MAEIWDETKPAGTRSPALGDDDIREFKRAMRERLALDHEFAATESPAFGEALSVIGMHKRVYLNQQTSDPTMAADKGALYGKEVAAKCEFHWRDEDGNIVQITSTGTLLLKSDTVIEKTPAAGVTVDGILLKDDTIKPTGAQLDIDISGTKQVTVKDGAVEPITTNDVDLGTTDKKFKDLNLAGDAYVGDDLTVVGDIIVNSIVQGKHVTIPIHTMHSNIGDWNMDAFAQFDLLTTIPFGKIRRISAAIRNDGHTIEYHAPYFPGPTGATAEFYIRQVDADIYDKSVVTLYRVDGGFFDSTDFNATGYNRGWITIDYVD